MNISQKIALGLASILLFCTSALAQFVPGQVLTAQQLNQQFSNIVANTLSTTGGTLTGPLNGTTANFATGTFNSATIAGGSINGATGAFTNLTAGSMSTTSRPSFAGNVAWDVGNERTNSVITFGAVSDCPNGTGVCSDNLAAFTAAISDAQANRRNVSFPCGDYYLSAGITISNTSDSNYSNFRPSLIGGRSGSARCVKLYFGPGNFDGITVTGTNGQSDSAISMQIISGISVSKADYQGSGFVIKNMSHLHMVDDFAQQFKTGFYMQDVQESLFENLIGQFNSAGGLLVQKGSFTPPNALMFKGCSFAANGQYGADIQNPAAVSFDGGSIEENGFNGGGNNWGIRAIFPYNNDVEGNIAMTVQNVYFERNSGSADILLTNGQSSPNVPTAMLVSGNNFNRGYNALGAPATISIASPAVVTFNGHGFVAGQPVTFTSTGSLPTGITAGTTYYVLASGLTANTFQISATAGGTPIATSGTQSGTQTVYSRTMNVVSVNTSNGNTVALTMIGNGMGGLPRPGAIGTTYVPSATTPYVSVLTPTDPITICDVNNFYADAVEKNSYLGGCTFAGMLNVGNVTATGTVKAATGTFSSVTSTGTGAMPLYSATGTGVNAPHMVQGTVALSSGSATVAFSGSAVFTSSSSYTCTANDTTAANAVKVGQTSGTSITFTGTGTDSVQFLCAGN